MKEKIDKEIDYLAHEIVVPITGEPSTPYEFDAIKKYKAELGLFSDHIRSFLTEEIEKVENRYTPEGFPLMDSVLRNKCHASFEVARQRILALLK